MPRAIEQHVEWITMYFLSIKREKNKIEACPKNTQKLVEKST